MGFPDLTSYYAIHTALRRGARALARSAETIPDGDQRRRTALARYWAGYAGEVLAHHTIEDEVFLPALVARVPMATDLLARTDDEHHQLDAAMEQADQAFRSLVDGVVGAQEEVAAALAAVADLMDRHLDFEDADVLPLFQRHFTGAEYEALDDQAKKALGLGKQAAFTVPFVAHWIDDDVRDRVFGAAPFAFRALWWATRGSHRRLTVAALGSAASPMEVIR